MSGLLQGSTPTASVQASERGTPSAPSQHESPDSSPSFLQAMGIVSDVGELGYLFGHSFADAVPTDLNAPTESYSSENTVRAMQIAGTQDSAGDTAVPTQPDQETLLATPADVVATNVPKFSDTVKGEWARALKFLGGN